MILVVLFLLFQTDKKECEMDFFSRQIIYPFSPVNLSFKFPTSEWSLLPCGYFLISMSNETALFVYYPLRRG